MTNVDYSEMSRIPKPGKFACLMCSGAVANPTVNDIDMLYFGGWDSMDIGAPQDYQSYFGVESIVRYDPSVLSDGSEISQTSQLVAVGAYDGPFKPNGSDQYVQMEAGFAADFFE